MITFPRILFFYLTGQFFISIACVLLGFLILAYTLELVELLRRTGHKPDIGWTLLLEMAGLRLPLLVDRVLPFAVFIGGGLTFVRLTRTHELIVARTAGLSIWYLMMPGFLVSAGLGIFMVTAISPIGSATLVRYQNLEATHLSGVSNLLSLSGHGLWVRQIDADGGHSVIHASRASEKGRLLHDVMVFRNDVSGVFLSRYNADLAVLDSGIWYLQNVHIVEPDRAQRFLKTLDFKTPLTVREIQNSFTAPETLSFWALPSFISGLEKAGFSALRHRLHWQSSLALPLVLVTMLLLSSCFTVRMTRQGGVIILAVTGFLVAFSFYFVSNVVHAMGLGGTLPVSFAAWGPASIALMMGLAWILHLEDG